MAITINLGFVATAGGTADVITGTWSPAPASLDQNLLLWFKVASDNLTTTPTLNANGLGAKTITKKGGSALVASDLKANGYACVIYDLVNNRWELLNPASDLDTTPTLAQVLAQGPLTNSLPITGNSGVYGVKINDTSVEITTDSFNQNTTFLLLTSGVANLFQEHGSVNINNSRTRIYHDTLLILDTPIIETTLTASRFVTTNAGSQLEATKTIPSGAVVGDTDSQTLTNKTIDGDDNTVQDLAYTVFKTIVGNSGKTIKFNDTTGAPELQTYQGYSLCGASDSSNPADATTYYVGGSFAAGITTSAIAVRRIHFPKAGTIKAAYFYAHVTGTLGSAQAATVSIRINNTTDHQISASLNHTATFNFVSKLDFNISVVQGDYFEFKIEEPTFGTNPLNVYYTGVIYVE